MTSYEGRVALVTGGAAGIGAALVKALVARGARVVLSDVDEIRARRLVNTLDESKVEAVILDVRDAAAFQSTVDGIISRHGRIDLLFNNAGVGVAGEVRDATPEDWRLAIEVNLWGVIHGVQAAYPHMVAQRRGHIINIASGAGLLPRPGMVPYAAAKHGVVGLSQSLRAEARGLGVDVSVVCPGPIKTNILSSTTFRNIDTKKLISGLPSGMMMTAERCAEEILRGVDRRRAIIPVTTLVRLEWLLYRVCPSLVIRVAELRARVFRKNRVNDTL